MFHLVRVLGGDPDSWLAQRGALDPRRSMPASVPASLEGVSTGVETVSTEPLVQGFASRVWRLHPRVVLATTAAFSAIMTSMIWLLVETR